MRTETLTRKELFQKEVRYVVLQFQRPYVWKQLDQWAPLWDDLQSAAGRDLHSLGGLSGDKAAAEKAKSHCGLAHLDAIGVACTVGKVANQVTASR